MAGRAPLERRVCRPLDGRQVVGAELRLLILDEADRQALDGQLGVLRQGGHRVVLGAEGVHQHERKTHAVLLTGRDDLGRNEIEERCAVANRKEGLRCLESHGIAQSMSRPGNPWDNALAESFFKTLKRELVNGKGYKTREEAKQDAFKYIELYYNRQRMHSSIGYNAPCDLERDVA